MEVFKLVRAKTEPSRNRGESGRKELILIVYDTVWVHRIHERGDPFLAEANPSGIIEVKAKYALVFTGPDDSNAIGQCYAMRGYAHEAEWVHDWHELSAAIERLRARHPGESFPDEIDYVIDWPSYRYWKYLKDHSSPGRQKIIQQVLDEAGQS